MKSHIKKNLKLEDRNLVENKAFWSRRGKNEASRSVVLQRIPTQSTLDRGDLCADILVTDRRKR
jgi:hypothetical protein